MKKISLRMLMLTVVMFLAVFGYGKEVDSTREADHVLLRDLKSKFSEALNNRDVEALSACFAKNFVLTTVDQTTITSKEQLKEYWTKIFDSPDSIVAEMKSEPEADVLSQFIDENNAFCYGFSKDTYKMKKGFTTVINSRWTATVVKENGKWLITTAHAGVNFFDNPVITRKAKFDHKLIAVGFVGGLLLGMLVRGLVRGKKQV